MAHEGQRLIFNSANAGFDLFDDDRDDNRRLNASVVDASDFIVDIREWDVPYHVRVMIDMGWYSLLGCRRYTDNPRYTNGEMVHGRCETRRYIFQMLGGTVAESRSGGDGLRY